MLSRISSDAKKLTQPLPPLQALILSLTVNGVVFLLGLLLILIVTADQTYESKMQALLDDIPGLVDGAEAILLADERNSERVTRAGVFIEMQMLRYFAEDIEPPDELQEIHNLYLQGFTHLSNAGRYMEMVAGAGDSHLPRGYLEIRAVEELRNSAESILSADQQFAEYRGFR